MISLKQGKFRIIMIRSEVSLDALLDEPYTKVVAEMADEGQIAQI